MTQPLCPSCGMQTEAGGPCIGCGASAAEPSPPATGSGAGHEAYWDSIFERLRDVMAPKYRVTGRLGYGGMAGVFAAEEPRLGRRVAIKVMSPALMMDPQLVERFVQEARTIALLSHPNIVTIFEVDEREGLHWFAMTHVTGRTLGQVMLDASEPLPIAVVRAWMYQMADALAYAHRSGVVHRDIKPGNVLLDERGDALVTDFGIAKVADADAGLTSTGMLVGTPAYMSPEQCSSGPVTGASDQYALGVVVYQMLTGRPPFSGATMAVLQAHIGQEAGPLAELRPDCPPELADAVHRMLAKRPEERWPTLSAAIAASGAEPPGMDGPVRERIELLAAHAATIQLPPLAPSIPEGTRQPLAVRVRDAGGRELPGRRIEWRSTDPTIAAVGSGENLNAFSPGQARIGGRCGGATVIVPVVVEPDPVGQVSVRPERVSVAAGREVRIEAVVRGIGGSRFEARAALWSSSGVSPPRLDCPGPCVHRCHR